MAAPAPARRVLLLALASRVAVLGAMLLADWTFADLDTSSRLQGFPCAGDGGGDGGAAAHPPLAATAKPPLAVWDTAYFSRVASCGYETDKINAFFPLLPTVMRVLAGVPGALIGEAWQVPPAAAHAAAAAATNVAAFCVAALCLHRLTLRVLGGSGPSSSSGGGTPTARSQRGSTNGGSSASANASSASSNAAEVDAGRVADLALLFFCLNPASVFYSAAYSESVFAAATWAGLLLLPDAHWAGVAAFTVAAAARSNGILAVWFPLHTAAAAAAAAAARRPRHTAAWDAARAALSAAVILTPYAAMQVHAYLAHCAGAGNDAPRWCTARLPSVYGFIQKQYWDVGLLRFYRDPARLPMVLMSAPVAWLSIGGCWAYFAADWRRAFTLGLFPRGTRLPRWLAAAAAALQRWAPAAAPQSGQPEPPHQQPTQQRSAVTGLVYLLSVALLWGSYTPALRVAYSLPGPPTPVTLTAASGVLELLVLLAALAFSARGGGTDAQDGSGGAQQAGGATAPSQPEQQQQQQQQQLGGGVAGAPPGWLLLGLPSAVLAGAEIGAYNSAATLAQIGGLSATTTTAARGAFLIQASTLFTPLLAALTGAAPSRPVWAGSLLAFAGTLIITSDRTGAGSAGEALSAASGQLPLGDALTLVAALMYSAATVRIPYWAVQRRVTPVQLAFGKALALTAVAAGGLALQASSIAAQGQPLEALWPGWASPQAWAVVAWAALGPGALASVLHVKGQSLVSPSAAQIVFCTIPIWSALLAAAVLPGEPVGQGTWLGGAVVAAAGLVAATGKRPAAAEQQQAAGEEQQQQRADDKSSKR
ncbi:GPI mannosyltransferase 2 isoform A [Micractinium conductrix]|uniref:GPI mannosyltransferase 2 isoform A n=1 Tax=Micractinium conductrix TaxID=554055 RepID=A0A2P6VRY1_9CHLO|nr:GPI mannosyltransferase 2 isoform A [Micractinium conductrix]|eukprot:PSC76827.1 GPI mannosyltransferase 2 isoform A [Micractinium conductrix]